MGQAWCKEKSTKAQDSKSPLDRVFLRCAHRIYPSLKEEGSVLGGATQRVTSSEIGYASSPPREVLTRGQSIDSVDRPFHPSDWVDVNLEVPVTPRASSVMTNLTLDTTIYPATTLTSTNSSGSNLRDFAPIPPPRRRKKNRGRPLPPKPDEVAKSHVDRVTTKISRDSTNSSHEPLYSSVKIPKNWSNEKEIYEHKVNGTGKIIPSIVVAASRSYRVKSSRGDDKTGESKNSRKKSSSTVSLPNYSELEVPNESLSGDDDGKLKERKMAAAGSLPVLITSGALESLKKIDNEKIAKKSEDDDEEKKYSVDEVDFSFDVTKNQEALNSVLKLEGPRLTSTPVKNNFEDDSRTPTTVGGWFLHQERTPESENFQVKNNAERHDTPNSQFFDCLRDSRSEIFFEAEEDILAQSTDNTRMEGEERMEEKSKTRTSLKRTLSNESEPFDNCEEKEIREFERTKNQRENSQIKVIGARTISEESLPQEMLVNDMNFFEDKKSIEIENKCKKNHEETKVEIQVMEKNDETKTPPPSPEPKIKPEIFDNDHSTLLKVLREEAEESNFSSMTPSLTELEAALSDMLEREDDEEVQEEIREKSSSENMKVDKILEKPIEPKIVQIELDKDKKNSGISVSLKNILGGDENLTKKEKVSRKADEDLKMVEINLTNGNKFMLESKSKNELVEIPLGNSSRTVSPLLEPPEKPSRLHQLSHEEDVENLGISPTPPKRKNRFSGHATSILTENERRSCERTPTPENPYPNDRLI